MVHSDYGRSRDEPGAAGYEILNLSLHRPSYYWSPAEERFFWDLLHELLARCTADKPEGAGRDVRNLG